MASSLSADTIIAQFENLVDDSVDQVTELFLLNEVKDTLETMRQWAILTAMDMSKTVPSGVAWKSPVALPSDFGIPSRRGIYAGSDLIPYRQVPFEAQVDFQAITYAYFIDYYNANYYLCGNTIPGSTIRFFYQRVSPTLALVANGGLPWIFPARFHPVLPYKMAKKYFAIDQGDKSKAWDDRWDGFIKEIEEAMKDWDDTLQSSALQNEAQLFNRDLSSYPTIIDMDAGAGSPGASMFG